MDDLIINLTVGLSARRSRIAFLVTLLIASQMLDSIGYYIAQRKKTND